MEALWQGGEADCSGKERFYTVSGTATITNGSVTNNRASAPGGYSDGGGFYNDGTVSFSASNIAKNSAPGNGGGLFNADSGGSGTVSISNSTIVCNSASDKGGGGLFNIDDHGKTVMNISNSTIASNSGGGGGGLYNEYDQKVSIGGTIVANRLRQLRWPYHRPGRQPGEQNRHHQGLLTA
ncbi:MAG TPA: hypothetical protein VKV20_19305 [Ktedonobacteraceae bacterium]|nr:hypothetical protein [Ktedonobacteraceae bacterium]